MKHHKESLYKLIRPIITVSFKLYYNPTIIHPENIPTDGAAVIAGNHIHALDTILVDVCTKRVVHTLAKKELHDGVFGWFFGAIGTIPVDRYAKERRQSLDLAMEYLQDGCLVNLSPEGTRNKTNQVLLPFKAGAVVMAQRTNSVLIPYSITGEYRFRNKNLRIVFDQPLDISNMTIDEANQRLYNRVKELIMEANGDRHDEGNIDE